ncbi:MAG: glutathione S-transferase family protein [Pseudomonadota bacterium]
MFIPRKGEPANQISRPDQYVVYGWGRSYFTHKLTAALDYYNAKWEMRPKTAEVERELRLRSGTHQVPVLHTPENWMIADTTPLLRMLDARFPDRAMFPDGALGVLVHMVEEYFDEWIARTTVHWRWNYPENHEQLSLDAAYGDSELASRIAEWGVKVCRATGVSSQQQQAAAEAEYRRILDAVTTQLAQTPFLLGSRPCAVDCIVLAGLRAHFFHDPAPRNALYDAYPAVVAWVEQDAAQWHGEGNLELFPKATSFARFVLGEMVGTYQPYVLGNRHALEQGDRAFVINVYDEAVSYLARPYIEESRRMIVDRIAGDLTTVDQAAVRAWLGEVGLEKAFAD